MEIKPTGDGFIHMQVRHSVIVKDTLSIHEPASVSEPPPNPPHNTTAGGEEMVYSITLRLCAVL